MDVTSWVTDRSGTNVPVGIQRVAWEDCHYQHRKWQFPVSREGAEGTWNQPRWRWCRSFDQHWLAFTRQPLDPTGLAPCTEACFCLWGALAWSDCICFYLMGKWKCHFHARIFLQAKDFSSLSSSSLVLRGRWICLLDTIRRFTL